MAQLATGYAASGFYSGAFDDLAIMAFAAEVRKRITSRRITLGLIFMSEEYFEHASEILETVRIHGQVSTLVGASSYSFVHNDKEHEFTSGISLALFSFPKTQVSPFHVRADELPYLSTEMLRERVGAETRPNGLLLYAAPDGLVGEDWLRTLNHAFFPLPIVGGLAAARPSQHSGDETETRLFMNGQVLDNGLVGLAVSGQVRIHPFLTQGCEPIGDAWTITKAERNFVIHLGNRSAYEVLDETYSTLPEYLRKRVQGNLLAGIAVDEYKSRMRRGDFLIRNLLGGDMNNGALALGGFPRTGQTMQFQLRDAVAADEDMKLALSQTVEALAPNTLYGGVLNICTGRGAALFKEISHDASRLSESLGNVPLTGLFCQGEIGPIGESNYLHSYSASAALFVD